MRAAVFFTFALLAVFVTAQDNLVERFVIDDFTVGQGQNILVTLSSNVNVDQGTADVIQDDSRFVAGCSGLIGCARDMRVQVVRGDVGRSFGVDVFTSDKFDFQGEWAINTPKGGTSVNFLQYDGNDGSFDLDINGLGGRDFTVGGLVSGIRFSAVADLETTFTASFFSGNGGTCEAVVTFPVILGQGYTRDDINFDIDLDDIDGDCDFTSIGAVQIRVPSQDAVDALVRQIRALGLPDPSPSESPSPSRTRTPAPSNSRSPAPSQSRTPAPSDTPSRTPSRSGPCIQQCVCPSFTCAILYDGVNSNNDVDLLFRSSQLILDDSDDVIVYVTRDDDDVSVTVPSVTVPSVTLPSVTVPSVTVPSVTFNVDDDDEDDDDDDDASGSRATGSRSSAATVCASIALVLAALLI